MNINNKGNKIISGPCLPSYLPMSSKRRESMKEMLACFILDHQAAVCTDRCIFESIQLPYSLIKASESVMKNCVISLHGKQPAQFVSDLEKIFELQIIWVLVG